MGQVEGVVEAFRNRKTKMDLDTTPVSIKDVIMCFVIAVGPLFLAVVLMLLVGYFLD